ncbi:hypothetical protein SSX86_024678 [Deinandra increscens subsp. villosa]|uniref:Uncharacterized protein n=1 Tax=Deinandra increscens subsp. villosa TaxID=3103831 RepID=A0AAP0CI13_9ASTR
MWYSDLIYVDENMQSRISQTGALPESAYKMSESLNSGCSLMGIKAKASAAVLEAAKRKLGMLPVRTKSDKPCRLQKFKLCSGLIKKQGFKGSFGEAVSSAKFGLGFTVCGDVESEEINEDMSIDASKQSDEIEQALGAANTLAKKAGGSNFPDIADGLDELNMV